MYKTARKEAGMTLEEAAYRLHCAPRTLCKYESGQLRVPPEMALSMGQVYNRPELPLNHCAEKCAIGRVYHPVFEVGNVATGTLQLMRELQDVNQRMDDLVSIAADGRISPEELPEFEEILQELMELGEAIERLKLLGIKKAALMKREGQVA
jgi:transcriptional regulator with XRE-family HTH domain